jgi:hypothetical protein
MFTGDVTESNLERALEQARHAEGPSEPDEQPSIVWLAGDGALCTYPTPWGQVLDFVLVNSSDLLAEGIGANVTYEEMMRAFREFRISGRTATPSFRSTYDRGESDELIATAAVAAIVVAAEAGGFVTPPAEELLVLDRAVIWTGEIGFYAYVMAAQSGSPFFADVIVPLGETRIIGIQTNILRISPSH